MEQHQLSAVAHLAYRPCWVIRRPCRRKCRGDSDNVVLSVDEDVAFFADPQILIAGDGGSGGAGGEAATVATVQMEFPT